MIVDNSHGFCRLIMNPSFKEKQGKNTQVVCYTLNKFFFAKPYKTGNG